MNKELEEKLDSMEKRVDLIMEMLFFLVKEHSPEKSRVFRENLKNVKDVEWERSMGEDM